MSMESAVSKELRAVIAVPEYSWEPGVCPKCGAETQLTVISEPRNEIERHGITTNITGHWVDFNFADCTNEKCLHRVEAWNVRYSQQTNEPSA